MLFLQKSPTLSILVLFLALLTQVLSVRLEIQIMPHDDGSYSYRGKTNQEMAPPSRDQMREWAKATFRAMEAETYEQGIDSPNAMATLFTFTNPSRHEGTLIVQSSIKTGARETSVLTRQFLNECTDRQHRAYGNCAEIGAMAVAHSRGLPLANSFIAVYGRDRYGVEGWLEPCRAADGYWGCSDYVSSRDVRVIFKRSRIEGSLALYTSGKMVVDRAIKSSAKSPQPFHPDPQQSPPKSKILRTGKPVKHTFKVDLNEGSGK